MGAELLNVMDLHGEPRDAKVPDEFVPYLQVFFFIPSILANLSHFLLQNFPPSIQQLN